MEYKTKFALGDIIQDKDRLGEIVAIHFVAVNGRYAIEYKVEANGVVTHIGEPRAHLIKRNRKPIKPFGKAA